MPETIRKVIRGGGTSRRTALGRLGAAAVGASAAAFIAATAAQAHHPPLCDPNGFPACTGGCGSVQGVCCWYVTDSGSCRTYRCCDRPDLQPQPWCTCRHFVGNFC